MGASPRESWTAGVFTRGFVLGPTTRILGLGSGDGSALQAVLHDTAVAPGNVYVADLSLPAVQQGFQRYGYKPILLGESEHLPFTSGFFDIVHCSSVLEHVTAPEDQQFLAREIRRVGRQYFVRTAPRFSPMPNRGPWSGRELARLFPGSRIVTKRSLGFLRSVIAIHSDASVRLGVPGPGIAPPTGSWPEPQ